MKKIVAKYGYEFLYTHTQKVRITRKNGKVFEDVVKSLNRAHAIHLAKLLWKGSKVEPVDD